MKNKNNKNSYIALYIKKLNKWLRILKDLMKTMKLLNH